MYVMKICVSRKKLPVQIMGGFKGREIAVSLDRYGKMHD